MNLTAGNLFADIPEPSPEEQIVTLASAPGVAIERIISTGQASPPDFWYDQPHAEWVLLVSGAAALFFENEAEPRLLKPGDYLLIAPHQRHRVVFTDPAQPTIWLAVHFVASQSGA